MSRFVAILLLLAAASVEAQSLRPEAAPLRSADLVTWRVRAERSAPGAEARMVLDAEIAPGWRLYAADSPIGIPFALTLDALPAGVVSETLRQGTPRTRFDPVFETDYTYFTDRARFVQPLRLGEEVIEGAHEVSGAVRYALCDDSICLAPARSVFRVALVVE